MDLALFADVLAARGAAIEARLEQARGRVRQAAIERQARRALPADTVERLVEVGALTATDLRAERGQIGRLAAALAALRELQEWTEARLAAAEAELGPSPARDPEPFEPPRAA